MALEDDIRILERADLLKDFTQEQLRLLAFGVENMRLPAGRELFAEGGPSDSAYVVCSGTVDLVRRVGDVQVTLATVGPGTMIGEYALIAGGVRHTGAIAATAVELIRLSRPLFRRILEEYPDIAEKLRARVLEDMRNLLSGVSGLSSKFED